MKTLSLAAITLLTFLCAAARAELKWEQTTIELHPNVGDKQAIAHFKYENAGKTPVHFKSVHASCGCTTAQTQKDEVPPGEKGEITATFNIGERTGLQVKTVSVQTDEPGNANTVLTLRAALPDLLTITPTFVYWKGGEEAKPKTITVKAGKTYPAKSLKVNASNADFIANVESGSAPGEWKINVQPKQTTRAAAGVVTIVPEVTNLPTRVFYANASVTAAPAQAPVPAKANTPTP
jgi:Protein of unknown function (DUF1573)